MEIELVGRIVVSEPFDKLKGEFFKTLGHPARIRILELLSVRDRSVGELLLRRAGVVVASKDGNSVIYSIASPDIAELLAVGRKVLTGMLRDRVAVLEDLRAGGPAVGR